MLDPAASINRGGVSHLLRSRLCGAGKRLKDKQWIGKTQEQGIQVCNWKRPTK